MFAAHKELQWFSRSLIETLPAAVYVCSMDGTVVAFNERAAEIWGHSPAIGQTDEKFCGSHKLLRPDGTALPHDQTPMEWVLRTGKPENDHEVVIVRPDNSKVTVLVNIVPIYDDHEIQIGAVNCFQDLTVQKLAEKERERLSAALLQSQKMEAVGQLTSGLAHDFNNLLAVITGNLELMQARLTAGKTDTLTRYVEAAQTAARRSAALTHRLLAFSRRQTLEVKTLSVNTVVASLADLIRRTAGPEINVKFNPAPDLWHTSVDPNQLENALLNLCINARDAMPDGGSLTVETANRVFDKKTAAEQDLPAGDYISLCVTDSGAGMSADVLAHAFEPFFTTKPAGMGTGLGLSMIYGFARQSGGQAHIRSTPGEGTVVCLYLLRKIGIEDIEPVTEKTPPVSGSEKTATVLVVDDEPAVRMLITEVLEEMGLDVVEADDAAGGLRILLSNIPIDLLITDVGLPGGMNGRQLADAARELKTDLPVLFVTGYAANAALRPEGMGAGMHVITKPFALDALASKVNSLVFAE